MKSGTSNSAKSDGSTMEAINIGLHLVEWDEPAELADWVKAYDEANEKFVDNPNKQIPELTGLDIDGYPAVRQTTTLQQFTYNMVTIKRGNVMWFIWGRIEISNNKTFDQVIRSFQWQDAKLPITLQGIGVEPMARLDIAEKSLLPPSTWQADEPTSDGGSSLLGAPVGYRMPFNGGYAITSGPGPNCGSAWHTGNCLRAIDYNLPTGTSVRSSSTGTVVVNAFDGTNGNYVGVQDNNNRIAFYLHLNTRTGKAVGQPIMQSDWIGDSGNTGNSTGPHLHFHVRTTAGVAVDIRDIPNTTWGSSLTWNDGLCTGSTAGSWAQWPGIPPLK